MSVVKVKNGKGSCGFIKEYLEKDDRAKKETVYGCSKDNWDQEMQTVKEVEDKTGGRQYYHVIQAIDHRSGDAAHDLEKIHSAGQELAQYWVQQGYQVVVVTHTDKENWHNHIIINSVNAQTGMKMDMRDKERYQLFEIQEKIDHDHDFWTMSRSIEENRRYAKEQGKQREGRVSDEIYPEKKGETKKQKVRENLQDVFACEDIFTRQDFEERLAVKGLKISRETSTGHITYQSIDRPKDKHRASKLGDFDLADINDLLIRNKDLQLQREQEERQREKKQTDMKLLEQEQKTEKKDRQKQIYIGWSRG